MLIQRACFQSSVFPILGPPAEAPAGNRHELPARPDADLPLTATCCHWGGLLRVVPRRTRRYSERA